VAETTSTSEKKRMVNTGYMQIFKKAAVEGLRWSLIAGKRKKGETTHMAFRSNWGNPNSNQAEGKDSQLVRGVRPAYVKTPLETACR